MKFEEDWRLKCWSVFFWVTTEFVSIHFPTCLHVNCLLYCLILLQALNCCPQEDAKRYNRNSFVLNRLLSRPSSVNLFFLSFLFLHLTEFFLAGWWSSIRLFAFFQCCHLLLSYFLSSVCLVSCAFFITTICFCVFCSLWWLGLLECHSCLKPTKLTQV